MSEERRPETVMRDKAHILEQDDESEVAMKSFLTSCILLLLISPSFAMAPEKADLGRSKKHVLAPANPSETKFRSVLKQSETAYALATANLGRFDDPRINSLSNRIQDDQRVIIETIRDTAEERPKIDVPEKTASIAGSPISATDYLERQITLHEKLLTDLDASASPVLQNMSWRVESIIENAKKIKKEKLEAQEDTESSKHPLSKKKVRLKRDKEMVTP